MTEEKDPSLGKCFEQLSEREFNELGQKGAKFMDLRSGKTGTILKGEYGGAHVRFDNEAKSGWLGGNMKDLFVFTGPDMYKP